MLRALLLTAFMGQGQNVAADREALVLRNRPVITEAVYHPDGKRVYCVTEAGVEAYDTATGKLVFDAPYGRHLVCSPNGEKLALVSTMIGMIHIGGTVVVLDGETGKKVHQLSGTFAAFSPDGRWLITHTGFAIGHPEADLPPKVQITDLTTAKTHVAALKNLDKPNKGFGGHAAPVHFRFSKDGKVVVGGSYNKFGQWKSQSACELTTGKALETTPKDEDLPRVADPRYSSDGNRFVADWQMFDVEQGKPIARLDLPKHLTGHSWYVVFHMSPDGKEVFISSSDRWELPVEIIADKMSRFCFPELRLGLIPGFGGIPRLRRDLGNAVVRDLLLTGRSMSATRAHAIGLVSQVAGEGESLKVARLTSVQTGKFDRATSRAAKGFLKPVPYTELRREVDLFCELYRKPAVQAGLQKFVESTDAHPYLP